MVVGILIVSVIMILLIGLSGRFSREHYIYESINPEENIESGFAPYYSSLSNTINNLYDC